MDTAQLSVLVNADAEQVWLMLREPARIAQWHGWEMEGLDDEIRQIYYDNVTESPDHLRLDLGRGDAFILTPHQDGTLVTLNRGTATGEWARYDTDITEGWSIFLQQLKFKLARHPHTPRRTVYVDGTSAAHTHLWDALGIDTGWLPDPGEPYGITLTTGDTLSGKVWYRTDTQLGLTVADYAEHGDGLLILAQQARVPGLREHPGAQVIASTFGLGAADLEKISTQWDTFMETHYPDA
ncbi:SRPBCC domain-containing protein [Arthrobacter sp. SDTb3-6]|uniref:SRPBCC domain-containing protein n=1 Tax=Arthrobacter sp. SDTb3-6 TaxID=2713571 RepID=UPI00159E2C6C|nr:SRPBCC domain-containing protein [Arthrobacter sp. SDTb3-6]NVM98962.1 SRPBCC domain-containing protein [Arthrobacter sp. SDTb3-6]